MIYALAILLAIAAYFKKDSKVVFILLFVYMVIVAGLSGKNPDLLNYQMQYENGKGVFDEPLYLFLASIFRDAGVDYYVFRCFLCVLALGLMSVTIWELSPYPNMVFLFYMIYPFVVDAVQIRSFVSAAFVVFGARYIIRFHRKRNYLYIVGFLASIAAGTGFHYATVFFLILLLFFTHIGQHKVFYYFVVPAVMIIGMLMIPRMIPLIRLVIGVGKTVSWVAYSQVTSLGRAIRMIVMRFGILVIAYIFMHIHYSDEYKVWKSSKTSEKTNTAVINRKIDRFYDNTTNRYLLLMSAYIFLYIALEIVMSGDYERLSRPALMFASILITRLIYRAKSYDRPYLWAAISVYFLLYFVSIMFFTKAFGNLYFEWVFLKVMEGNLVLMPYF